MPLISCPECNHSISDTARKCPSCGYVLKKPNYKKIISIIAVIIAMFVGISIAYYFLIYTPQHIPEQAAELLSKGDYLEAERLYARLPNTEENNLLREQLYYESRIVAAAKAEQKDLVFPDSMIISEVVIFEYYRYDESSSSETNEVHCYTEPVIVLHYLAQSKGGSMVDGYVRCNSKDGIYTAGKSLSDLNFEDTLPWYIDDSDYEAKKDFWAEQESKALLAYEIQTAKRIGVFDLDRCNSVLTSSLGHDVKLIPAGNAVVTPTPYTVTVTPKPND